MKKPLAFILLTVLIFQGVSQNIYHIEKNKSVEELVLYDYEFHGSSNVFYKDDKHDDWNYLHSRDVSVFINDTTGCWIMVLDNDSDNTYTVYEYYYKEITWDNSTTLCLISHNFWGMRIASLCIDSTPEECYIYIMLKDESSHEWFMHILECDFELE